MNFMDQKTAVESKTIWVNSAAPILSFVLDAAGLVVPAEVQIAVLLLRFATNKGISALF
jgi:hypothetical protein